MTSTPRITLIAAADLNGVIGHVPEGGNPRIPWRIPSDQQMFKQLTLGNDVTMGRVTYFSFPESVRPLPGRRNIVITNNTELEAPGAKLAHSIEDAMSKARGNSLYVAGGEGIYKAFMPLASRIILTRVQAEVEGNRFFPAIPDTFKLINGENGKLIQKEGDQHPYQVMHYMRAS